MCAAPDTRPEPALDEPEQKDSRRDQAESRRPLHYRDANEVKITIVKPDVLAGTLDNDHQDHGRNARAPAAICGLAARSTRKRSWVAGRSR